MPMPLTVRLQVLKLLRGKAFLDGHSTRGDGSAVQASE